MSSAIEICKLSPNIGAEVIGVDVSQPLDEPVVAQILQAWHEHCVLLFRGQRLTEDEQVRFAGYFGELGRVLRKDDWSSQHHPAVMLISNIREDGKLIGSLPDGEMMFHSDQCYAERPSMASLLYAIEIPSSGGNTLFANMYRAYETLPGDLKVPLAGKKALNVYDYDNNATTRGSSSDRQGIPSFAHPIFRTHPATGKKALYVNRLMTECIVGMDRAESDRVLALLFDHAENPAWIYEHRWQPGDLLMWDNRCVQHARTDFDASERRLLRRCVVLGDKPC